MTREIADGTDCDERSRPSNRRHSEDFRNAALDLIRERYRDFGPTLAREKLIEEPAISLAQIAVRCGFGSPERFRRAFIRATGTAPDDYRKGLRPSPQIERHEAA
jgi:transcriptional regulator GlxA family with amidase domain